MDLKRPLSRQPIPNHAKKVFSGQVFTIYQWEQTMFDGSKAIFEKVRRTDTVGVIPITDDGRLILSEQSQPGVEPFIGTLGGRLDPQETPLAAAQRELLEEAGMVADHWILWQAEQPLEKIDWAIYNFIAKGCRQIQPPSLDVGEKIKLLEFTFDQFVDLTTQENFRDWDIALQILRLSKNKTELTKLRKLFRP